METQVLKIPLTGLPHLSRSRQEWRNIVANNPRITELAKDAVTDIEKLFQVLEEAIVTMDRMLGVMQLAAAVSEMEAIQAGEVTVQ